MPPPTTLTLEEALWARVSKTDSCWLWTGSTSKTGYGNLRYKGRLYLTHRLSWEITRGPIPKGLHVLHNCPGGDNPACVNPAHLFLGTQRDNNLDRDRKRGAYQARGERSGVARLTDEKVRLIRQLRAEGHTQQDIADTVGISRRNVASVLSGLTWKHV